VRLLDQCLESLFNGGISDLFEVIVVDNGSTDGSVDMVRARYPHVRILANSTNLGFTVATNQGIRGSRGAFVLMLNSDTIVRPGAVDRLVEYAEAHPDVGVAGSKLILPDGT